MVVKGVAAADAADIHTPKGKVFHFDLYRMKNVEEIQNIGINNDEALAKISAAIVELRNDGTLKKLGEQFFGKDISVK